MRLVRPFIAAALLIALMINAAAACPFCPIPEATIGEQLSRADVALLVQWVSSRPGDGKSDPGGTTYRVVQALHQPGSVYVKDAVVTLTKARSAQPGAQFLLMGVDGPEIQWNPPLAVTEAGFKYIMESPGREEPAQKRLSYFLKFLDHADPLISNDAFSELAGAPYKDIAPLANQFSAARLKAWIADPNTVQTRIGFYGLMLGLCGSTADAGFLKAEIDKPSEAFRLGLDGMMGGYVLLKREEGLPLLEARMNAQSTMSESYAVMQTLRFLWEYAPESVGKDRLRQTMRKALDRPELAELAITDLTRWEDWDALPRLVEMFDSPAYREKATRRAVARFLIILSAKKVAAGDDLTARRVAAAKEELMALRDRDPATIKEAERYRLY